MSEIRCNMKICECKNITKQFKSDRGIFSSGRDVVAVKDVSFDLLQSEILGVIGESGSGKSTLAKIVAGLIKHDSGSLDFSTEIFHANDFADKALRGGVQIVFQDPQASLNPRIKIGDAICEPLIVNKVCGKREARSRAVKTLESVGLDVSDYIRYPHEFSGGQKQRICIARALILHPKLLILDEPVSALDVSVQAQILILLKKLKLEFGMTYIFVSHDIRVIEAFCDRVIVMCNGVIVEQGDVTKICSHPEHEYTKKLISSVLKTGSGLDI